MSAAPTSAPAHQLAARATTRFGSDAKGKIIYWTEPHDGLFSAEIKCDTGYSVYLTDTPQGEVSLEVLGGGTATVESEVVAPDSESACDKVRTYLAKYGV